MDRKTDHQTVFDAYLAEGKTGALAYAADAVPERVYHAEKRFISKHMLDLVADSPQKFRAAMDAEPEEPTPAMKFGSAFHTLVLEPEKFWEQYYLLDDAAADALKEIEAEFEAAGSPLALARERYEATGELGDLESLFVSRPAEIKVRRGKAWDEFVSANAGRVIVKDAVAALHVATAKICGKEALTAEQFEKLDCMRQAVLAHAGAGRLFRKFNGESEVTILTRDAETGTPLKCRVDRIFPNVLGSRIAVDLKTCASASPEEFARAVANFRYYAQAAFYLRALDEAFPVGEPWTFVFIAVEKEPPYAVATYQLSEWLGRGNAEIRKNLNTLKACEESGEWEGYSVENDELPMTKWLAAKEV